MWHRGYCPHCGGFGHGGFFGLGWLLWKLVPLAVLAGGGYLLWKMFNKNKTDGVEKR